MTSDDKRVALLSNPKPSARMRALYVQCTTQQEAILHFKLRRLPEVQE